MSQDVRISLDLHVDPVTASGRKLYRVLHDIELGPLQRFNTPEVIVPPLNAERTPFGADWQRLSFALNPGMSGDKWRSLYGNHRAFNNNCGFPQNADDGPHADYVNMRDLDASDPCWDKTHGCCGATLSGEEDGDDLIVEILEGFGPAPDLEYLRQRPWLWFHAVNVNPPSTNNPSGISRFAQNDGRPCIVPLVGSGVARIELYRVQRVPTIADPYVLGYRPSPYANLF